VDNKVFSIQSALNSIENKINILSVNINSVSDLKRSFDIFLNFAKQQQEVDWLVKAKKEIFKGRILAFAAGLLSSLAISNIEKIINFFGG
jgi:hypothetical protein